MIERGGICTGYPLLPIPVREAIIWPNNNISECLLIYSIHTTTYYMPLANVKILWQILYFIETDNLYFIRKKYTFSHFVSVTLGCLIITDVS